MTSDMFKDSAMRVFLIHLTAFVVITAGLAALNLWVAPQHIWFIWVLAGWGIAVATHDIALLIRKTHRRERIFIDPKARAFAVHLFAYLAVVLLLFVVNYTQRPTHWWFYWVALAWGAGLVAHGWCVFRHRGPRAAPQKLSARHVQPVASPQTGPKRQTAKATPRTRAKPSTRKSPRKGPAKRS
jgi:hypothetical protein